MTRRTTDPERPTAAVGALAGAIDKLRKLDRQLTKNGFRGYSDPLRDALAELEHVRQMLTAEPVEEPTR